MKRKCEIMNSAFIAVLNQYDEYESVDIIKNLIENKNLKDEDFWYSFGYKYIGVLVNKNKNEIITKVNSYTKLKNVNFILKILDLIYDNTKVCDENKEHQFRFKVREKIHKGAFDFCEDFTEVAKVTIDDLPDEIAFAGIEYLSNHISRFDENNLSEVKYEKEIGNKKIYLPLTPRDNVRFGIVYPWPGTNSAESELLIRFKRAAEDIGFECIMLSNYGKILDRNQKETTELVNPKELDFVLTTHYESHKTVDNFYYHLLWNPPEIPLNTAYYEERVVDNYIMNDDYLIYDYGGMSNHLRSLLMNRPRTIEGASTLVGSFPSSAVLEPKLENPKLFYCGMNWEKVVNNSNRHEGLFKLLDETGVVKFFGPDVVEAWGGVRPWEGYKCYQYSIPFDGFSILKEINECGICLAISSDIHRRAGAVTNRTYEACAAGAVIISDNNVFMEENFKDAVLFINYNKKDPEDTFRQIMEKYDWIKANPDKALEMAKRAQKIFLEKFTMDKQLIGVVNNHYNRFKCIEGDLFAKSDEKTVLVTSIINSLEVHKAKIIIDKLIANVENQYYRNIVIGLACDKRIEKEIQEYCLIRSARIEVISLPLFDDRGARVLTDGQAIRIMQNEIYHDYYINIAENEQWYYDHITTLVRTLEDNDDAIGAYAGRASMDKFGDRRTDFFETLKVRTAYRQEHPDNLPIPGQFLFRRTAHEYIPDYVFDCLDGLEHSAYVNLLWFKYKKKLAFSKRLTCIYRYDDKIERYSVLDHDRQIRFIRGLVKYDLPASGLESSNLDISNLSEKISNIPLRSWLKMRYYRMLLRRTDTKSNRGKALLKKYETVFNDYKKRF